MVSCRGGRRPVCNRRSGARAGRSSHLWQAGPSGCTRECRGRLQRDRSSRWIAGRRWKRSARVSIWDRSGETFTANKTVGTLDSIDVRNCLYCCHAGRQQREWGVFRERYDPRTCSRQPRHGGRFATDAVELRVSSNCLGAREHEDLCGVDAACQRIGEGCASIRGSLAGSRTEGSGPSGRSLFLYAQKHHPTPLFGRCGIRFPEFRRV